MPTFQLHPARPLHVWLSGLATCLMLAFAVLVLIGRPPRLAADDPPPNPPDPGPPILAAPVPNIIEGDDPNSDSDGDGIPNQWEDDHSLDRDDFSDAGSDFDNDGLTALQEFMVWNRPDNTDHAYGNPLGKWRLDEVAHPDGASSWISPVAINNCGEILVQTELWDPYRETAMVLGIDGQWREIVRGDGSEPTRICASDLNDRGEVVGQCYHGQWMCDFEPFIWDAVAGYRPFTFNGSPAEAVRINNYGDWIGTAQDPISGEWKAAHVVDGVNLRPAADWWPFALYQDINDFGEAMGIYATGSAGAYHTFLATGSWLFDTGNPGIAPQYDEATSSWWMGLAMNNWGEYSGAIQLDVQNGWDCAAYYFDGAFHPVRPSQASCLHVWPDGLSDSGLVAGYATNPPWNPGPFLWRGGLGVTVQQILPQHGPYSVARINDHDQILTFNGYGQMCLISPDQDHDGDGLSDDWEFAYGLEPANPYDAFLDPDADGTDNLGEFLLLRNPNFDEEQAFLGGAIPDLRPGIDTDGDGIPNIWEWEHSLDYDDRSDGPADPDHDGHTNLQEYRLDTDPHGLPLYRVGEVPSGMNWLSADGFLYGTASVAGGQTVTRHDPATGETVSYSRSGLPAGSLSFKTPCRGGRALATMTVASQTKLIVWESPAAVSALISLDLSAAPFRDTWSVDACSPDGQWAVLSLFTTPDGQRKAAFVETGGGSPVRVPAVLALQQGWSLNGTPKVNDQGMVLAELRDPSGKNHAAWWDAPNPAQAPALLDTTASGQPLQMQTGEGTWETVVASTAHGLSNEDAPPGRPARAAVIFRTTSAKTFVCIGSPQEGFQPVPALSWPNASSPTIKGMDAGGMIHGIALHGGKWKTSTSILKDRTDGGPEPWTRFGEGYEYPPYVSCADPDGDVFGYAWQSGFSAWSEQTAMLWLPGKSAALASLCPDAAGISLTHPRAAADGGRILVSGHRADGTPATFLLSPDRDTDGDGTSDAWENAHRFRPYDPADGSADPDGDGLPNTREAALGTDPHNPDCDSDRMPDGWEAAWGFNPLDPADATGDPDDDHVSNLRECQIGTPPAGLYQLEELSTDGMSPPALSLPGADGSLLVTGCDAGGQWGWFNLSASEGGGGTWTALHCGASESDLSSLYLRPWQAVPLAEGGGFRAWGCDPSTWETLIAKANPGAGLEFQPFQCPDYNYGMLPASPDGQGSAFGTWQMVSTVEPSYYTRTFFVHGPLWGNGNLGAAPLPLALPGDYLSYVDWQAVDETGTALGTAWDGAGFVMVKAACNDSSSGWAINDTYPVPPWLSIHDSPVVRTAPGGRCVFTDVAGATRLVLFDPATGGFEIQELHKPFSESLLAVNDRGEILTNRALYLRGSGIQLGRLWTAPTNGTPAARLDEQGYRNFSPAFFDPAGNLLANATRTSDGSHVILRISPAQDQDDDGLPDDWERSFAKWVLATNPSGDQLTAQQMAELNASNLQPLSDYTSEDLTTSQHFAWVQTKNPFADDFGTDVGYRISHRHKTMTGAINRLSFQGTTEIEGEVGWNPYGDNYEHHIILDDPSDQLADGIVAGNGITPEQVHTLFEEHGSISSWSTPLTPDYLGDFWATASSSFSHYSDGNYWDDEWDFGKTTSEVRLVRSGSDSEEVSVKVLEVTRRFTGPDDIDPKISGVVAREFRIPANRTVSNALDLEAAVEGAYYCTTTLLPADLRVAVGNHAVAPAKEDNEGAWAVVNFDDDDNDAGAWGHGQTALIGDLDDANGVPGENDMLRLGVFAGPLKGALLRLKFDSTHIRIWKTALKDGPNPMVVSEQTEFDASNSGRRDLFIEGIMPHTNDAGTIVTLQVKVPNEDWLNGDSVKIRVAHPVLVVYGDGHAWNGVWGDKTILAGFLQERAGDDPTRVRRTLAGAGENRTAPTYLMPGKDQDGHDVCYSVTPLSPYATAPTPDIAEKHLKIALQTPGMNICLCGHANYGVGLALGGPFNHMNQFFNMAGGEYASISRAHFGAKHHEPMTLQNSNWQWRPDVIAARNVIAAVNPENRTLQGAGILAGVARYPHEGQPIPAAGNIWATQNHPWTNIDQNGNPIANGSITWHYVAHQDLDGNGAGDEHSILHTGNADVPASLKYRSLFLNQCNSYRSFIESFRHGVVIASWADVGSSSVPRIYVEGIVDGWNWARLDTKLDDAEQKMGNFGDPRYGTYRAFHVTGM